MPAEPESSSTDYASAFDLAALSDEFEKRPAADVVAWAVKQFGDHAAVSSSFGADSAVMLHMAVTVKPDIKIVTVDTGFLFPETLQFRDELTKRLKLNLLVYRPALRKEEFLANHGKMWQSNPDACCGFNKREPFERAKKELGLRCWMTGIRRDQASARKVTAILARDHVGLVKVCPIAAWSARDVHNYLVKHELPYHPLRDQGYLSIGCQPEEGYCTVKVQAGADPRSGRWAGFDKTECGLHTYDQGTGI